METLNFDTFLRSLTHNLEPFERKHLKNVYSTLTISLLAAAAGAYLNLTIGLFDSSLLIALVGLGLLVALSATPDDGKNQLLRLSYLTGFAFISGINMGPLLNAVIMIDPSIIPTAFLGTAVIFICFTLSALVSERTQWLYLGGILMSMLSILMFSSILNLFIGSRILYQGNLYLGLIAMCGFVLYDTQIILLKCRRGDKDFIWHSVNLFTDFIGIFRRLLVILGQKEQKKNRD